MWTFEPTTTWERDHKHYAKKRPRELAAVLRNLERYEALLKASPNSKCVQAGYIHTEQAGVLAIDQKGGGASLQETRMYIYADDERKIVYLLAIGGKDAQHSDVEYCRQFVKSLKDQP